MSLSIATYTWQLVFTWMSTKAAPFGRFVAAKDYGGLDELFFRTLYVSLFVVGMFVVASLSGIIVIQTFSPHFAMRMVSPWMFALLLLGAVGNLIVQCEAIYLRAHKEEPLLWQAVAVAALTIGAAYFAAPRWGVLGICIVDFLCMGVIATTSATVIFRSRRRSRAQMESSSSALYMEPVS